MRSALALLLGTSLAAALVPPATRADDPEVLKRYRTGVATLRGARRFGRAADAVVLWNPWGTDFHPNGPSGPENGYDRAHGVFRIPFDQFVTFFTFLAIEEG